MPVAYEQLGILGIMDPFTKMAIQSRMQPMAPGVTYNTVDHLWETYLDATTEKKLPPFLTGEKYFTTLDYMVQQTGLPKNTVGAFATALRLHAQESGSNQYIDPAKQAGKTAAVLDTVKDTAKTVIEAPAKVFKTASAPALDVVTKTAKDISAPISQPLKWLAIGIAGVAVLYVGYQVFTTFGAVKKVTGKGK
jgi:hypothetical protein